MPSAARHGLSGYGLEELGIPAGQVIETDEYLQTLHPSIYAAGDVAGPLQFTHAAAHQAWYASVNALFGFIRRFRVDYRVIPRAIFLDPEIARVGLSEAEARAQGIAFKVTRYGLDDLDRAIVDGAAEGFIKILTPPGSDRILGAAMVGEHAGDLIAEIVLAMKTRYRPEKDPVNDPQLSHLVRGEPVCRRRMAKGPHPPGTGALS